MNEKLGKELINKNNNAKEIILNEISDKIILLRKQTINVCQSMRKLKTIIFSINNLDKYNIDKLSKKFQFDKNYLVKMKAELNFLKDGFAKYYFNIENDQTPFLLKASNKNEIAKDDYFLRIIPLNPDLKNIIIDCIFYIHQELIAYQNYNMNKKDFRRISPIKKKVSHFNEKIEERNICKIKDYISEKNSLKNNIERDNMNIKGIDSYIGYNKKLKDNAHQSHKNIFKSNGNNIFSNKNNLKKSINENIKDIIKDTYDNISQKKENYEKDQITQENLIDSGNIFILNDKTQSSLIKEEINEHISKTPFSSTEDEKNKLNL